MILALLIQIMIHASLPTPFPSQQAIGALIINQIGSPSKPPPDDDNPPGGDPPPPLLVIFL